MGPPGHPSGKRAGHEVQVARNACAGQHAGQAGAQLVLGRGDTDGGKGRCRAAHQRIGRLAGGQQHGGRGQWRDVRRARSAGHGVDAEVIRPGIAAGLDPVRRRAGERDGGVVAVAIDGHIGGDHGAIGVEDAQLAAGDGRAHGHGARQCSGRRHHRHRGDGGRCRRRRAVSCAVTAATGAQEQKGGNRQRGRREGSKRRGVAHGAGLLETGVDEGGACACALPPSGKLGFPAYPCCRRLRPVVEGEPQCKASTWRAHCRQRAGAETSADSGTASTRSASR